tara:strand:- start:447 stop:1445 length:999 start_codon:yes stop_codon:yes gene_type:complete
MFNGKSILVTGGTGSFGRHFVNRILKDYPKIQRLVIFSRDELKQSEMQNIILKKDLHKVRFFLGDVRDSKRLHRALHDIDIVVHAAALKQVPAAEYNPFEFIQTNIIGAQNIIDACLSNKVTKVLALSTDKASGPINLYGATKLCADKLFIAANNIVGKKNITFSIIRYGNVMASRGSIIPIFMKNKNSGILPITDTRMTRFNISVEEGVDLAIWALKNTLGGEIVIPKIPSIKITDLAKAIAPNCKFKIIGARPGEKLHEGMITQNESYNTVELKNHYLILPERSIKFSNKYLKKMKGKYVKNEFSYNSNNNKYFLSIKEIKKLLKKAKIN